MPASSSKQGARAIEDLTLQADIPERTALIILASLTALAAILRLYNLDSQLWYDEIRTVLESVRPPLSQTLTDFPSNNDHSFYSLLAHLSVSAFGESPWSIRLPAVIFAVASVPMLYLFGRDAVGRTEGLLAAGLLAVSYHNVWYSQNARGYTMMLFFTLLLAWFLIKAMKTPTLRIYSLYAIAAALACYTHLTMVYVVIAQAAVVGVHILASGRKPFSLKPFIAPAAGFILAAVLTLALYYPSISDMNKFFSEERVEAVRRVATPGWAVLEAIRGLNIGFAGVAGAATAVILLAVGGVSYLRRTPLLLLLYTLPAPLLIAAAVLLERPMFPRFFFALAGFALLVLVRGAMLAGAGLANFLPARVGQARRFAGVAIVFIIGGFSLASLPAAYHPPKQDFVGAIAFVEEHAAPGEARLAYGGSAHMPIKEYHGAPFDMIVDIEELDAVKAPFWLALTFPEYIERRHPSFWSAVGARCDREATFKGSVAGGEVLVFKCGA